MMIFRMVPESSTTRTLLLILVPHYRGLIVSQAKPLLRLQGSAQAIIRYNS